MAMVELSRIPAGRPLCALKDTRSGRIESMKQAMACPARNTISPSDQMALLQMLEYLTMIMNDNNTNKNDSNEYNYICTYSMFICFTQS